jgi:hypothetical protein
MSKSPLRAAIAKQLYDFLLAKLPFGLIVRREDPRTLKDSEPEPDIAVVRGLESHSELRSPAASKLR